MAFLKRHYLSTKYGAEKLLLSVTFDPKGVNISGILLERKFVFSFDLNLCSRHQIHIPRRLGDMALRKHFRNYFGSGVVLCLYILWPVQIIVVEWLVPESVLQE